MQISARNQLRGVVREVKSGAVMAEVVVEITGDQTVVSAITDASRDGMGIREGDEVTVVIKSTDVMIGK